MNLKEIKERKTMKTKTKQITRTRTELEKWTSHGAFSVGKEKVGIGGKMYGEEEA